MKVLGVNFFFLKHSVLVKLFNIEYYRDLEILIGVTQGHSNW